MKGPGNRIKFVVRRVWECPVCHRQETSGGDVVHRLCTGSAKSDTPHHAWMRPIEAKPPVAAASIEPPAAAASLNSVSTPTAATTPVVATESPPPDPCLLVEPAVSPPQPVENSLPRPPAMPAGETSRPADRPADA